MTTTYVTEQVAPLATTETMLYTLGTVSYAKVVSIFVANRAGTAATFRITQSVGGGATATKDWIYPDAAIAGNGTFLVTTPIFANTGDVFRVYASSANLSFNLHAQEVV